MRSMRPFQRPPARVADGISGQLRLQPTGVTFATGEDIAPARAGGMAGRMLSSQTEAASFAECGASARQTVGDVSVEIVGPAVETVVAHVEAPGRERRMRLRVCLFAASHLDPSGGPVGARYLLLRRRDV